MHHQWEHNEYSHYEQQYKYHSVIKKGSSKYIAVISLLHVYTTEIKLVFWGYIHSLMIIDLSLTAVKVLWERVCGTLYSGQVLGHKKNEVFSVWEYEWIRKSVFK